MWFSVNLWWRSSIDNRANSDQTVSLLIVLNTCIFSDDEHMSHLVERILFLWIICNYREFGREVVHQETKSTREWSAIKNRRKVRKRWKFSEHVSGLWAGDSHQILLTCPTRKARWPMIQMWRLRYEKQCGLIAGWKLVVHLFHGSVNFSPQNANTKNLAGEDYVNTKSGRLSYRAP